MLINLKKKNVDYLDLIDVNDVIKVKNYSFVKFVINETRNYINKLMGY